MAYIDFENGICEGWSVPMYQCSAEQFVEEIKKHCTLYDERITRPSKSKVYEYRYIDGTIFKVIIDTIDDEDTILEILGMSVYDKEFDSIYSWH